MILYHVLNIMELLSINWSSCEWESWGADELDLNPGELELSLELGDLR